MTSEFHHVRLELAREPGAPAGDPMSGYDLVVPLDPTRHLDADACKADSARCRVRRFHGGQTLATGHLRRVAGGRWIFDFAAGEADDETGFRWSEERFVTGEYLSLIGAGGEEHTFRITQVEPLKIQAP